jgi:hypothetical protein
LNNAFEIETHKPAGILSDMDWVDFVIPLSAGLYLFYSVIFIFIEVQYAKINIKGHDGRESP